MDQQMLGVQVNKRNAHQISITLTGPINSKCINIWHTAHSETENKTQGAYAESTNKGVKWCLKNGTQTQQQRPELPVGTHLACM